jgi:hypothetical protein
MARAREVSPIVLFSLAFGDTGSKWSLAQRREHHTSERIRGTNWGAVPRRPEQNSRARACAGGRMLDLPAAGIFCGILLVVLPQPGRLTYVAHLVEHLTDNQRVTGSTPVVACASRNSACQTCSAHAGMAKLADIAPENSRWFKRAGSTPAPRTSVRCQPGLPTWSRHQDGVQLAERLRL